MKKVFAFSLMLSGALLFGAQGSKGSTLDTSDMNFFKNKGVSVLGQADLGELYLVSAMADTPNGKQKLNVFVTKDKKYVIFGGGYNDKTGEALLLPVNMTQYAKEAAFSVGNGKKELYVFTDPECPFCIKMENEFLSKFSQEEYKVNVFLFPLSFHKNAEAMSMYILSKKSPEERLKALHDISKGDKSFQEASYTEKERSEIKNNLSKQQEIASKLGVNGTPTIFDSNGAAQNWTALIPSSVK